jgi:hypothetical protein
MALITMQSEDVLQKKADVLQELMVKTLKAALRGATQALGATLTAAATNPSDPAWERAETRWMEAVSGEFFPHVVGAYADAAEDIHLQLVDLYGGPAEDVPFVSQELALEYLRDTANRMVAVTEGTWARARGQLIEGFAAGESIEELSARLRSVTDWSEGRAATVARTEIISASNAGALAEVRTLNPEASKEWMATKDSRTREWHREADGETVLLNGTFTVGGEELDFPGDPTGSPENVINCRCSLSFHVPRETVRAAVDDFSALRDVTDEFDPADFMDFDSLTAAVERVEFLRKPFDESKHRRGKGGKFAPKGEGGGDGKKIDYKKPPKKKAESPQKIDYTKSPKKSAPAAPAKKTAEEPPAKKAAIPPPAKKASPAPAAPEPVQTPEPPSLEPPSPEPATPAEPAELTPNFPLVEVTDEVIDGLDTDSGQFAVEGQRVLFGDRLGTVRHARTDESGLSDELFVQFDDNPTEVESVDANEAEVIDGADVEEVLNQPFDADVITNMPADANAVSGAPSEPLDDDEVARDAPFAISSGFDPLTTQSAQDMQDEMTADDPWSVRQEDALVTYSGDAYVDMNGCLRFRNGCSPDVERNNDLASEGMRPTTRPTTTFRGANFASLGVESHAELESLVGATVSDPGFTSTSITPRTFQSFTGDVALQIEVPEGTPAAYIDQISEHGSNSGDNPPELELLLDRNTRFEILEVGRMDGRSTVRVRVLP